MTHKISIKNFSSFLLVGLILLNGVAQAQCNENTIDESVVASQPEELTLTDLVAKFGNGCLRGMTAMTYQFKGKSSGKPIWFWLKNEPEPAFVAVQKAIKTQTPPNIGVLMAVTVGGENDGSDSIIWPKTLVGKSANHVIHDTYYKKTLP